MGQDTEFGYGWNAAETNPPAFSDSSLSIQDCMHRIVCTQCGKTHGYCSELNPQTKESDNDMDLGQHYDKGAKGGGNKFKRTPFLKAKDIPNKGCSAKITDFREAPKGMPYSDFLVDVAIGKKEFTWGLRSPSVTLNMLIDELGKRSEKWIGKSIRLVHGGPKGQYVNLG